MDALDKGSELESPPRQEIIAARAAQGYMYAGECMQSALPDVVIRYGAKEELLFVPDPENVGQYLFFTGAKKDQSQQKAPEAGREQTPEVMPKFPRPGEPMIVEPWPGMPLDERGLKMMLHVLESIVGQSGLFAEVTMLLSPEKSRELVDMARMMEDKLRPHVRTRLAEDRIIKSDMPMDHIPRMQALAELDTGYACGILGTFTDGLEYSTESARLIAKVEAYLSQLNLPFDMVTLLLRKGSLDYLRAGKLACINGNADTAEVRDPAHSGADHLYKAATLSHGFHDGLEQFALFNLLKCYLLLKDHERASQTVDSITALQKRLGRHLHLRVGQAVLALLEDSERDEGRPPLIGSVHPSVMEQVHYFRAVNATTSPLAVGL